MIGGLPRRGSSCFSFVVFRVDLIVVSCLKDGAVDEVLKAVGFEASCCAIIVVVVVGLKENERTDDAPDNDRGEIDDIDEKEGDGVSMDIDENIFDRICSPPLFDFVDHLTNLCIILYFDHLLSWSLLSSPTNKIRSGRDFFRKFCLRLN